MSDPEKWVNPLRGYAYDSFNKDALLRLAKAENGKDDVQRLNQLQSVSITTSTSDESGPRSTVSGSKTKDK